MTSEESERIMTRYAMRLALQVAAREDSKPKPIIVKERPPEEVIQCAPATATLH
jgi:hypothetical protein